MTRSLVVLFSLTLLGCPLQGPQGLDAPAPAVALNAVPFPSAPSYYKKTPARQTGEEELGAGAPEIFKRKKKKKQIPSPVLTLKAKAPQVCTMDYRPVCGLDGKTYSNDCARQIAGVARAHTGACGGSPTPTAGAKEGATCGGIAGISCGAGLFCNITEADGLGRQTADRAGTCAKIPQVCTRDYRPVCGLDGKTYSNDCARQIAGVARVHTGACQERELSQDAPADKEIAPSPKAGPKKSPPRVVLRPHKAAILKSRYH